LRVHHFKYLGTVFFYYAAGTVQKYTRQSDPSEGEDEGSEDPEQDPEQEREPDFFSIQL